MNWGKWTNLYRTDSLHWRLLCWEGRSLLMHMFQRFDRQGRIIFPERVGAVLSLAKYCELPENVVRVGLKELIDWEVLVVKDNCMRLAESCQP